MNVILFCHSTTIHQEWPGAWRRKTHGQDMENLFCRPLPCTFRRCVFQKVEGLVETHKCEAASHSATARLWRWKIRTIVEREWKTDFVLSYILSSFLSYNPIIIRVCICKGNSAAHDNRLMVRNLQQPHLRGWIIRGKVTNRRPIKKTRFDPGSKRWHICSTDQNFPYQLIFFQYLNAIFQRCCNAF